MTLVIVSFSSFLEHIPEILSKNFNHRGYLIVYPAQDKERDSYSLSAIGELVGGLGLKPFHKVKEKAGKLWGFLSGKKDPPHLSE